MKKTTSKTDLFRKSFYPAVSDKQWNDWRWQLANRLTDVASLERLFTLSDDERKAIALKIGKLPLALTPYYASLFDRKNAKDPLRLTQIPSLDEAKVAPEEKDDPLGEDKALVAPNLVHRYPDRVLFLATTTCASYCRYCNRSRMVCQSERNLKQNEWTKAFTYIKKHKEIRDVLISGGDPLLLSDAKLDELLKQLRAIKHVEIIRIGTKIPMTLPQRITKELVDVLKKYHPLWISLHAIHPNEITPESSAALQRLADAGLPIGSQTVLLKEVNDKPSTLKKLMHLLMQNRVTPYALFQLDLVKGSSRFRTSIQKGLDIIASLRGHTTGYAVPAYIVDPAGGGGKVQLTPSPIVKRKGNWLYLKNFEGKTYRYFDPPVK